MSPSGRPLRVAAGFVWGIVCGTWFRTDPLQGIPVLLGGALLIALILWRYEAP